MEQKREALSTEEIHDVLQEIKDSGMRDENLLSRVRKDLEFGLTREEVDIYLKGKFRPQQMRKLSLAIRKYGVEFAKTIAKEELDDQCMQVAIDFYDKGIPLDDIQSGVLQKTSAYDLKQIYESMIQTLKHQEEGANSSYVEKLLDDMREIVVGINRNAERYELMSEKLMEAQFAMQLKEKDETIKKQQQEIEQLKEELQKRSTEKDEEKEEMKNVAKIEVPVQYVTSFPSPKNGQPITAVIEKSQPKNVGLYSLIGRLAYKKKSKQDIIKLVASGELSTEQLAQIKMAMQKGLTEPQLLSLIHGNVSPEQMQEIIEIAVLENSTR